ncbi:MAG: hypothetical protein PUC06_03240 [Oscillospiraceae bacterium]|nr:hypothetical protein [Oscillospiraceae bacterium]
MKRVLALLLAMVLLLSLAACGGEAEGSASSEVEESDAGLYMLTSMKDGEEEIDLETLQMIGADSWYLELREDGTGTLYLGEDNITELKWRNGVLKADGDRLEYTREGDTITLAVEESSLTFTLTNGEAPAASAAPEAVDEPEPEEPESVDEPTEPETAYEGTLVETSLFSFVYGDEWTFDPEDDLSDYEDYVYASPQIPDPENDWDLVYVNIEVNLNEPNDFAYSMYNEDMEAYKAVVEGAYEVRNIGGIDFWVSPDDSYSVEYFGYDAEANAFIDIYVSEAEELERVDSLLNSIQWNFAPYSGDVTPWYWEGEAYSVAEHTTTAGGFTVTSKLLPNDVAFPTYDIFGSRVAVNGDTYYVLDDGVIEVYTRSGDELTFVENMELPFEPDEFFVDADGAVIISSAFEDPVRIDSGTETTIATDVDTVTVHPSGAWGVGWFLDAEVKKVELDTGAVTTVTLSGLDSVSHVMLTDNYVVVSGTSVDEEVGACLKIYDLEFNEIAELNDTNTTTDYYGSVSAAVETDNGLMIFDGNMRDVYFLDTNCDLLAAVDMNEMFGTDYPWPSGAIALDDGSVIVCMTDERPDESCDETLLFQVTGF